MDENSGTSIFDSSIHGHHASVSSSTAWIEGKQGSGIDLSHSTIAIPNDSFAVLPPAGGPFSLSFWIYPSALQSDWSGLMSCTDGKKAGWKLAVAGGPGRLRFWSTDSGGTLDLSSAAPIKEDAWNKIDITYNGGIATLYVNGLKVQPGS